MKWVFSFADPPPPHDGDAKHVLGGKGASLQEMTRAGLQVPPGFTLRTQCCQRYYENNQRWPDGLEAQVRDHLAHLEHITGRTYGRGRKPLLVSVRSGAAVSMPGMMDTLLNCGLTLDLADDLGNPPWFWPRYLQFIRMFGRTVDGLKDFAAHGEHNGSPVDRPLVEQTLNDYERRTGKQLPQDAWELLVACINAVFASWQSERAVAYRQRHDIRNLTGTAVNVQAMWPSEISGVCFTQDPTNAAANRVVIESAYGLGEAVVSGEVHPDRFLVSRKQPERIETHVGKKQSLVAAFGDFQERDPDAVSLTPLQVRELFDLAMKIEQHYGHPVDLEWGWADGRFALLQARPIRGLDTAQTLETVRQEEIARLKQLAHGKRKVWVTHNLGETLRAPTPMTWDIMRQFMSGDGGFGAMYRRLGYRPSERVRRDGFLELICGRIYADPDRLAELFWEGMPLTYDLDALAQDKTILDRAPAKFDAAKADGLFLLRLPINLWSMWRSARKMKWHRRHFLKHFEAKVLPTYREDFESTRAQDLSRHSDAEVVEELDARCRMTLDEFGPASLLPGFFGGLAFDALEAQLAQLLGPHEGAALAGTLTLALDGDITFEQDRLLYEVAHGKATLAQFLERFGHRAIGEMELATPRWREDAKYLEQTVARLKANPGRPPDDIHQQNLQRRQQADHELPGILASAGGSSLREDIEANLAEARTLLPYRETGKYYLMMGYELIRQTLEELGRRWDLGGGIYFLHRDELMRFPAEAGTLRTEIAERKRRWQALQRLDAPDIVDSQKLDGLGVAPPILASSELIGAAMAPGVATGIARVVADPQSAGDLGTDYILVCASTDPGWTPLFLNARGLVVERGGVLSHGAIVARDFGIPAVSCPHATQQINDGDLIRVDGNQGRVYVVQRRTTDA
jgi:rifampicin phosphotransferase